MAQNLFVNLLGVIGCVILLYFGLKLTKNKRKRIMVIGYFFIVVGLLVLFTNLYMMLSGYN